MNTAIATYRIVQTASGVVLWEGKAESKAAALDALARDAGYPDHDSIPEEIGGGDTLDVVRAEG